jgi:ArsR family transcriptional regulator
MGASKIDHYEADDVSLAAIAKALGHPARIAIVQFLSQTKACICGDIVDVLPLAQPTVSQHLKELKSAGIIRGTVEGNAICYCLDNDTLVKLSHFLQQITSTTGGDQQGKCC